MAVPIRGSFSVGSCIKNEISLKTNFNRQETLAADVLTGYCSLFQSERVTFALKLQVEMLAKFLVN